MLFHYTYQLFLLVMLWMANLHMILILTDNVTVYIVKCDIIQRNIKFITFNSNMLLQFSH